MSTHAEVLGKLIDDLNKVDDAYIEQAEKKIRKSRYFLFNEYPFFGMISLYMKLKPTLAFGTMGVDGVHLYYNPIFVNEYLSEEELNFVMLHEVLHLSLHHLDRRVTREKIKWNYATDYAINYMIKSMLDPRFKMPDSVLYKEEFGKMSAEEIYPLIKDEDISSDCVMIDFHDLWDNMSEEQRKNFDRYIKSCMYNVKDYGKYPEPIRRMLTEAFSPKKDWREELWEFLQKVGYDYSFYPTDRRFVHQDLLIPNFNIDEPGIQNIYVAIDLSGSISDEQASVCLSELRHFVQQVPNVEGKVIFFDASVHRVCDLNDHGSWEPVGGGGTDFRPIFDYIKEQESECYCCIIMTDLYGEFPEEAPDYPVLWVNVDDYDVEVPFGKVCTMK